MIVVVDYGMGNLQSIVNAFDHLGVETALSCDSAVLADAEALFLPGVGAFGDAIGNLRKRKLDTVLHRLVMEERKPCLGICLGMQLLLSESCEQGSHRGLNFIPGTVERITPPRDAPADEPKLRVPHVGWNSVCLAPGHPLFAGLGESADFYFVHSYHCLTTEADSTIGWVDYGGDRAAVLAKDNIHAVQFHPEKSQGAGLALLGNWIALVRGTPVQGDASACSRLD